MYLHNDAREPVSSQVILRYCQGDQLHGHKGGEGASSHVAENTDQGGGQGKVTDRWGVLGWRVVYWGGVLG